MDYNVLVKKFIKNFPELEEEIQNEIMFWGKEEIPPNCFMGNVINQKAVIHKILSEDLRNALRLRLFDFFEEMAVSGDQDVKDLLQVTILEYLWDDKKLLDNAIQSMHRYTKRINDNIFEYLDYPDE